MRWWSGHTHTHTHTACCHREFLSVSALAYRLACVASLCSSVSSALAPVMMKPTETWENKLLMLLCFFWSRLSWIQIFPSMGLERQYEKVEKSKERRFTKKWEARASSSQTVFTQTEVAYTIRFPNGWFRPRCCSGWWMENAGCCGEALWHQWDVTGPHGNTYQGCTWSYPSWPGTHTHQPQSDQLVLRYQTKRCVSLRLCLSVRNVKNCTFNFSNVSGTVEVKKGRFIHQDMLYDTIQCYFSITYLLI